jgi:hypothetical protein
MDHVAGLDLRVDPHRPEGDPDGPQILALVNRGAGSQSELDHPLRPLKTRLLRDEYPHENSIGLRAADEISPRTSIAGVRMWTC